MHGHRNLKPAVPVAPNVKVRMETQHPLPSRPAPPRMLMTYYGKDLPIPFYVANAEINMTVSIIIVPIQDTQTSIG